jgi:hypothetical protein
VAIFYYSHPCSSPTSYLRSSFACIIALNYSSKPIFRINLIAAVAPCFVPRTSFRSLAISSNSFSLSLSPTVGRIKEYIVRLSRYIYIRSARSKSQVFSSRIRIRWNLFCLYVARWVISYTPSLSLRVACGSFYLALLLSFGGVTLLFLVFISLFIFSPSLPLLLFVRRVYSFYTLCLRYIT